MRATDYARLGRPPAELIVCHVGDWILRLKPNGKWSPANAKRALGESKTQFSGNFTPYNGFVPIGFMAAVTTDYKLDVAVSAATYLLGNRVKMTAKLTDRGWPSPDGKITVFVTLAYGSQQTVQLRDDGTNGDTVASDAVWSGWFDDTAKAGNYKFRFKAIGHNTRGELTPREDVRYVTLKPIEATPRDPKDPREPPGSNCTDPCRKICEICKSRIE